MIIAVSGQPNPGKGLLGAVGVLLMVWVLSLLLFFADALRKPTFDSVFIRCEDGEARNAARPLVGRLGDLCSFFVRDTPLLVEN